MKPGDFIIALATAGLAAGIALAGLGGSGGLTAQIRQQGRPTREIALTGLKEPVEIRLEQEGGWNVIRAENGRIRVESASCAHQDCVRSGWLDRGGQSAVCLENRVSVTVVSQGKRQREPDAVIG